MMKHNMKYGFLSVAAALAVLTLTGCQRENLTVNTSDSSDVLKFSVGFAGSGELVLSKGATLASEDGTVSIPLSCTVTDGIEVNLPDAAVARKSASLTKGTQINSETEFLDAGLTSFTAAGWNSDKSEFIPSSTTVSYSDSKWQTLSVYKWRGVESKTFLAYANLPSSGATVANSVDPAVKQTFNYTVPTDARQQNDVMLGWYEGNGGGTATAAITMVHPLTAVVFKAGEIDESITAIKNISIAGVYTSGKADVTYELSGSDIVPTYDWKAGTVADTRTGSQTVTLAPLSPAEKLEIDEDDNTIGVPFIILPQAVAAGALTLKITVVKDGADAVLAASVPAGIWQEGKTNTFTLGYTAPEDPLLPGIFSVSSTKQVRFARGNLFSKRSGSAGSYTYEFAMESHQYDYRTRYQDDTKEGTASGPCVINGVAGYTPNDMSGVFLWDIYDEDGYGAFETSLTSGTKSGSDVLDFGQVFGTDTKWTTLTQSEFEYLTNGGSIGTPSRPNANNLIKKATIHLSGTVDVVGFVIAPDDFTGTLAAEYTLSDWETAEEASGLVFLPWIGRDSEFYDFTESRPFYWSKTVATTGDYYAYCLTNNYSSPTVSATDREDACPVRLVQKVEKSVEYEYVDLGLSVLWATFNIGAETPEGFGDYFAWGDVAGRTPATTGTNAFAAKPFSWTNTPFNNGETDIDATYFIDHKSEWVTDDNTLKPEYDAASVNWGDSWRMPTKAEFDELIANTNCSYTSNFESTGVCGFVFTNKKDASKSIFLPVANFGEANDLTTLNYGNYWSSSLNTVNYYPQRAYYLHMQTDVDISTGVTSSHTGRYIGNSVRPVMDKPLPEGALRGLFSVSATEQVHFSKGNLYCTDNGTSASPRYTFGFEQKQYDLRLRNSAGNFSMKDGSLYTVPENESGMFQWNKSNAVNGNDYGAFSTGSPSGEYSDHIDWGKTISEKWFTLNTDQWDYLVGRTSSTGKSLISWAVVGRIGGIGGLVLAPDNYSGFDSEYFECTLSDWQNYESKGCVFLPACGEISLSGTTYSYDTSSYYMTSDAATEGSGNSNILCASYDDSSSKVSASVGSASRSAAHPVRLVIFAD